MFAINLLSLAFPFLASSGAYAQTVVGTIDVGNPNILVQITDFEDSNQADNIAIIDTNNAGVPYVYSGRIGLGADPNVESRNKLAFPIRWQTNPELVRVARSFRHRGLPVVRLWQSNRSLLAIGLSPRGVPGIYFTQTDEH